MRTLKSGLRSIRDLGTRLASKAPFRPLQSTERRVLLIRPDHFGDLLFLAPALRELRNALPDHELVLMCGPWNAAIAERVLDVDRIVPVAFPGFTRGTSSRSIVDPYRMLYHTAGVVRDLAPRASVVLRDDHWWGAWMCKEAGIPLRFGYDRPAVRRFLTHPVGISMASHYVEQNDEMLSAMAAALGHEMNSDPDLGLVWPHDEGSTTFTNELLREFGIEGGFFVVHPGSGAPVKNWSETGWASVIHALVHRLGLDVLLTGSKDEVGLARAIACQSRTEVHDACGRTSLSVLAALFARARLVLGVDSGPLHLAVATGTPTVHLYGPSDPIRYGPWGDPARHRVVRADMSCPICGDLDPQRPVGCGCMMAITPERVIHSATEVLENVT